MTPVDPRPVRVLVAEDSAVTRDWLVYLLEQDPGIEVAGVARDGVEAVERTQELQPDLVVMDIHMPRLNGYQATLAIMETLPRPVVMVSASLEADEIAMTFEALRAGALMVLHKPPGPDHPAHEALTRQLLDSVKAMAEVKVVRHWPRAPVKPPSVVPPAATRPVRVVAIGASTGGPAIVGAILGALPADLPVPVLLVQHMASGFVEGLAKWLDQTTPLVVRVARAGETIVAGSVYVAPDDQHMGITPSDRVTLAADAPGAEFRPSASYLFESVRRAHGAAALGILLTGMGRDGAQGLKALRDAGSVTIAQDEASSVVFGMPGEAIRLGAATYVLAAGEIAETIRRLCAAKGGTSS